MLKNDKKLHSREDKIPKLHLTKFRIVSAVENMITFRFTVNESINTSFCCFFLRKSYFVININMSIKSLFW